MNLPGLSNQQVPAAATTQSPRAHSGRNEAQSCGFGAMLAKVMTNPDPGQPTAPKNAGELNHETSNAKETFAKANSRAKTPERNAKAHSASDAMTTAGEEGNPGAELPASNETVVTVDTKSGREDNNKGDVNEDPETKTDTLQTGLLALESVCAPIVIVPPTQPDPMTLSPKNAAGLGQNQSANSRSALLLESLPTSVGAVVTPQGESPGQPVSSASISPSNLTSNTNTGSTNTTPSQVAGIAPNTKSADGSSPSVPSVEAIISDSMVNPDVQATATDQKASKDNMSAVNAEAAVPAKALGASPGTEADAGEPIRVVSRANPTRVDLKRLQVERLEDSQPDQTVGTGTASQARQMQSEEQQNQFADRQKQNLPEKPEIIHATAQAAGSALTEDRTLDVRQNALFGIQNSDLSLRELGGDKSGTAMTHDIHPSVGRLVSDISHESMILRQFKPDKLDVVIRPDADTQISLQLRLNGNDVQGIARCERGDFNLLNSHWNELQQTMDQQGVRLAPLRESGSTMSFTNGNSFGNSSQTAHDQRGRRLEEIVVSERESALRPASSIATTAIRGSRTGERLLQTWA